MTRLYCHCSTCGCELNPPRSRGLCTRCNRHWLQQRAEKAKDALGRRCLRCKVSHPLIWDHIKDDGGENTRTTQRGWRFRIHQREQREFTIILRTGKSDRLQLHCPNCNYLKSFDPEEYARPPRWVPTDSLLEVVA